MANLGQSEDPDTYFAEYSAAKERHLSVLLSKINIDALKSAASMARHGIRCRVPAFDDHSSPASRLDLVSSQCGGQNCHMDVDFDDGITWIARIRLQDPLLPPASVQKHIFLSEIATLQFLARTAVPAPQVHYYQLEAPNNAVGASYVLMDKLQGKPLDWYEANHDQRLKVMEQLADVYLELERHPFPTAGSIIPLGISGKQDLVEVGSYAQLPWFETLEKALGPFSTLEAAYTTMLDLHLRAVAEHKIPSLPVDNYLSFKWRLAHLPSLVDSSASKNGPFYLKHFDDKGDHILVDQDYNITGIIDWEFASTEAKELAFSSPCMMWPVGDFFDGKDSLSEDECEFVKIFENRGRRDLAELIVKGRPWQRYLLFVGGGVPTDATEFEALFQALRKSFTHASQAISSYPDWKEEAIQHFSRTDARLGALLRDERAKNRNTGVSAKT